ncbi:hypothetical protein [Streptomyces milbemycinicus]|uniref:Uncharacterized protein n=1 Tax=Streptomyces milbemycinicus TaxID=476552 RepID=A0ABW8LLX2_9ACTN
MRMRCDDPRGGGAPVVQRQRESVRGVRLDRAEEGVLGGAFEEFDINGF